MSKLVSTVLVALVSTNAFGFQQIKYPESETLQVQSWSTESDGIALQAGDNRTLKIMCQGVAKSSKKPLAVLFSGKENVGGYAFESVEKCAKMVKIVKLFVLTSDDLSQKIQANAAATQQNLDAQAAAQVAAAQNGTEGTNAILESTPPQTDVPDLPVSRLSIEINHETQKVVSITAQ